MSEPPVCRTVSYTDQDCDNVSRQRCETTPGHKDCRDIPYTENECGYVTRYDSENYACTLTVTDYVKHPKKLQGEIQVQTNGLVEEFPLAVSVAPKGDDHKVFTMKVKLLKQPKIYVVLKRNEVKVTSNNAEQATFKGVLVLEVLEESMLPLSFPAKVIKASVEEKTQKLSVVFEGPISSEGGVELIITHDGLFGRKKTVAELKADYPGPKVQLGHIEEKVALSIDLKGAIVGKLERKRMQLSIKLKAKMDLRGELLNDKKPLLEKIYDGTFVALE